jgi:hypothetical protein
MNVRIVNTEENKVKDNTPKPVILLAATNLGLTNTPRLAITCKNAGFSVAVLAGRSHPVRTTKSPDQVFMYSSYNSRGSLRRAIEAAQPQLIIPCDDFIVRHLHTLHAECVRDGDPIAQLIEASLGAPEYYKRLERRDLLIELASLPDVQVPPMCIVDDLETLKAWIAKHGLPVILKLDGRFAGKDMIKITAHADIGKAYANIKVRQMGLRGLWNILRHGEIEQIMGELRGCYQVMTAQSYISGRPANCAVACRHGEVLGFVAVEAMRTMSTFGPATVVRRVEGAQMRAAAESIVRHLGISGMCGFDFVIDEHSGAAMLIEINPRATQINHFPLGSEADLSTSLLCALEGRSVAPQSLKTLPQNDIALFPGEWKRDHKSPYLHSAWHDVPYEEPGLLKYFGYEPSAADLSAEMLVAGARGSGLL